MSPTEAQNAIKEITTAETVGAITELPKGWRLISLDRLGRWVGGGTPSKANPAFWVTQGIPWVSPKDMKKLLIDDAADHISEAAVKGSTTNLVPADSVLVVTRSGILSHTLPVAKALRTVAINQDLKALIPSEDVVSDYILYALLAYEPRILQECGKSGTTVANLDTNRFLQFQIPVPPLDEQRRIVARLDALLARSKRARAELARVPGLVERQRQAVLERAFSGELTREWRIEHQAPSPSPGQLNGLVVIPLRNGLSVRGSDEPPGVRSLRLSALRDRIVDMSDVRFLDILDDKSSRYLLKQGDVLISRGNGTKAFVGLASLVPEVKAPTIFPDTAFRVRLDCSKAISSWFTAIWNAPQARKQIEARAKTTAGIWKVSQEDLAKVELLIPSLNEQREIVRRIELAFARIDRAAAEAEHAAALLDRLDQATLARAFRGEL